MRFALTTSIVVLAVSAAAAPRPKVGKAIPITKRSGFVNDDKPVDFDALNSQVASLKAKIHRGFSNFEQNTGEKHPSAFDENDKRGAGDPLTDYRSQLWYGTISVGTPAKSFTVDFDTGSSDLFLPASTCGSTCSGHTLWNPTSSSTAEDLNKTFSLLYGDGSAVSGEQYTDTVLIAGYSATSQTLGAATTYSSGFKNSRFPADGLMGMAFQSISRYRASPVFQTLVSEGQVTDPVFSFKLSSSGAELYIGGSNNKLYTGSFTYTPVTVEVSSVLGLLGGEHGQRSGKRGEIVMSDIDSIIDTGTTLIVVPSSQASSLYNSIGGTPVSGNKGYYSFPCDSFPTISLTFGGTTFPIFGSALNLGRVSSSSFDCVSGLVGQDTGSSFWTVGDVFLRGVYTAFDYGNSRVGFAQLA